MKRGFYEEKIYIISSITTADINFTFLDSMLRHCEDLKKRGFDARLILAPTKSYRKNCGYIEEIDHLILKSDKFLNKKVKIHLIQQNDFAVDPISAVLPLDHSVIVPGINHTFKSLPRQAKTHLHPKIISATGSVNNKPLLPQTKEGLKVGELFVTGALIVEIANNEKFHVRQLTFDGKGYQDLNRYYSPKKVTRTDVTALVMGDLHPGETCPLTLNATFDMFKLLKPTAVILHDWFSGSSISHHLLDKPVYRAQQNITLKQEVEMAAKMIKEVQNKSRAEVYLVASNHPEHLERYLQEGRFMHDSSNLVYAAELFGPFVKKENIFKFAFSKFVDLTKIKFLKREDSLVICGFELGNHGDHGLNGSKSAKNCMSKKYVENHVHTPAILPTGGTNGGTSTYINLNYTNQSGFTSWINSHVLIYKNGTRSLTHIIDGQYTIQK